VKLTIVARVVPGGWGWWLIDRNGKLVANETRPVATKGGAEHDARYVAWLLECDR
jgi:hypothetical protein